MQKIAINYILLLAAALCTCACGRRPMSEQSVAYAWADMTLRVTRYTPANSPTFASRCLGYMGVCMYETVAPGQSGYHSLVGQLNGLASLPKAETGASYHWVLVMNAGQAHLLKHLYQQTSDTNKQSIDSLEAAVLEHVEPLPDKATIMRSVAFGQAIAAAIFEWAKTDKGHRGYLQNFDKKMVRPQHLGAWKPPLYAQSFSHHPLHPYWGQNRTFLAADAIIPAPPMIPYDTTPGSAYREQFQKVYEKEQVLTQDEKEAALWWGDDPAETFTPPGHSYYLATVALRKTNPPLIKWAETYAKVGIAVADAFIDCWKWKYQYFSERPNTYVTQFIDPDWESFWPDPPFPAFPSGHAIQSAAAATVLTDLFGEPFALVDSAHVGRPPDGLRNVAFKPRTFNSFWEVAVETANSRFYGGIHTPQDNEAGQKAGVEIGKNVNALRTKP